MPIILMLISFLIIYPCQADQIWEKQTPNEDFSIKTEHKGKTHLKLNYCFVFNQGRIINCMGTHESIMLLKTGPCYTSKVAFSARTDKKFPLSICFNHNQLIWNAETATEDYMPENIIFSRLKDNTTLKKQ